MAKDYTGTINLDGNLKPTILGKPFAYNASIADFTDETASTNRATLQDGFPISTSLPIGDGGVPPSRIDFNTLGYNTTSWLHYFQKGGVVQYDANIGLYPEGARLWVKVDGKGTFVVRAKQENQIDPASVIDQILSDENANWELEFSSQKKPFPYPNWGESEYINALPYVMPRDGWLNLIIRGSYYYWYFLNDKVVGCAYARGTDYISTATSFIPVQKGDVLSLQIMSSAKNKTFKEPTPKQINTGLGYLDFTQFIPAND
jgi:hypothetical protein